ncbi:beta-propeller domain-containing protein [Candidatus Peregrinibacteria bacterium]|nr:beta-propeller domain-containing protein [Candidatus Peregrinibacteria bacterium]
MKRIFLPFLTILVSFSVVASASADFSDSHGISASKAINYLQESGVVVGYTDGTYKPDQLINRDEFLKITLKAADILDEKCTNSEKKFSDVKGNDWSAAVVCSAVKQGIIDGYPDGSFRPQTPINYAEASKIISKIEKLQVPENAGKEWFSGYISVLHRERVAPQGMKNGWENLKRSGIAEIMWGLKTGFEVDNPALGDLPQIESCEDLSAQIEKYQKRGSFGSGVGYLGPPIRVLDEGVQGPPVQTNSAPAPAADFSEKASEAGGAADALKAESGNDYSTTNLQEFGVDEADIIKNDGTHIFLVKGNAVRIIQAYPPENMKEVASLKLQDTEGFSPQEMYLDANILTIIGYGYSGDVGILDQNTTDSKMMIAPDFYPRQSVVKIISFDVSDRSSPKQIRSVDIEGSYLSSRKIEDVVYAVVNKYENYWGRQIPVLETVSGSAVSESTSNTSETTLPSFKDSAFPDEKVVSGCKGIYYFPNFETPNYLILAAIDTKDTSHEVSRSVILGSGDQVYGSEKNLYVTRQQYNEIYLGGIIAPRWSNAETTEIYEFGLDGNKIDFLAKGTSEGRVLNQFSMSEYNDYFRIATQKGSSWGNEKSSSSVFIYDKNLKQVGKIEDIAPGEDLKSVRFVQDRGYLITFKHLDPLFVIDMNPSDPKIVGKLKIPGWSDYLEPYDENHLIGFGQEVDPASEKKEVLTPSDLLGMKLSLFDVTDVSNPLETQKVVIGSRGTTSEVLTNHKALLFDKEKGILGFPITVTEAIPGKILSEYGSTKTVFVGAYVYNIDLKNGFTLRGKASHYDDDSWFAKAGEYFYGDPDYNIQRIIYIAQNFYTISQNILKAYTWENLTEVKSLVLDTKKCAEIYMEAECAAFPQCQTVWQTSSICRDTTAGKVCDEERKDFLSCEDR